MLACHEGMDRWTDGQSERARPGAQNPWPLLHLLMEVREIQHGGGPSHQDLGVGKAAQKDKGFIIKKQHFDPSSLHETSPSGLYLINLAPTYREQMQSCQRSSLLTGMEMIILRFSYEGEKAK